MQVHGRFTVFFFVAAVFSTAVFCAGDVAESPVPSSEEKAAKVGHP